MAYHDPRQPSQEELKEIRRKFCTQDDKLVNLDRDIFINSQDGKGYLRTWATVNKIQRKYLVHHIIWFLHYGEWPKHQLDPKDTNPLNNKIDNLRYSTPTIQNLNKIRKNGLPPGVFLSNGIHFRAEIQYNKERIKIGKFDTKEEAAQAYKEKYKELHGVELDV